MTLYTRHQLLLVLLLVGAAGAGLAVDHWRRAWPDLAERIETLDRTPGARRRPGPAPTPAAPVDVNRATEVELARLPGVGPTLASRIVAARPFGDVDELRRVRGVRRATLERLRPLVTAGQPGTGP
jgi:competence protein ComEA